MSKFSSDNTDTTGAWAYRYFFAIRHKPTGWWLPAPKPKQPAIHAQAWWNEAPRLFVKARDAHNLLGLWLECSGYCRPGRDPDNPDRWVRLYDAGPRLSLRDEFEVVEIDVTIRAPA